MVHQRRRTEIRVLLIAVFMMWCKVCSVQLSHLPPSRHPSAILHSPLLLLSAKANTSMLQRRSKSSEQSAKLLLEPTAMYSSKIALKAFSQNPVSKPTLATVGRVIVIVTMMKMIMINPRTPKDNSDFFLIARIWGPQRYRRLRARFRRIVDPRRKKEAVLIQEAGVGCIKEASSVGDG